MSKAKSETPHVSESIQIGCQAFGEPGRRHPASMAQAAPEALCAARGHGDASRGSKAAGGAILAGAALVASIVSFTILDAPGLDAPGLDAPGLDALGETALRGAVLLAVAIAAVMLLVLRWRKAARGAMETEALLREVAAALEDQRALLREVADSQPTGILIVDESGRVRFTNKMAARRAGLDEAAMIGTSLEAVLGPARAARYRSCNRVALETGVAQSHWTRRDENAAGRVILSEHIPMASGATLAHRVLVVERDVTAEVVERERRKRTLERVVQTLLGTVGQRDPYAAHHAERLGELAGRIARELGLDELSGETARIAGSLLTVGKSLVPEVMLTYEAGLLPDECRQARASLNATIELLDGLEFQGPVTETLRQLSERFDGAGVPRGLSDEAILVSARILKVANSFLGLVSRSPGCPGLAAHEAVAELRREAGTVFDPAVLDALVSQIDKDDRAIRQRTLRPSGRRPPRY